MPVLLNALRFVGIYMGTLFAGFTAIAIGAGTYEYFDGRHRLPSAELVIEHSGTTGERLTAQEVVDNAPVRVRLVPDANPQDLSDYDGLELSWVLMRDSTVIKRGSSLEFSFAAGELVRPVEPVDGVVPPFAIGERYSLSFGASKLARKFVRKRMTVVQSDYSLLYVDGVLSLDPTSGALLASAAGPIATPVFAPEPGLPSFSSAPAGPSAPAAGGTPDASAPAPVGSAPTPGLLGSLPAGQ